MSRRDPGQSTLSGKGQHPRTSELHAEACANNLKQLHDYVINKLIVCPKIRRQSSVACFLLGAASAVVRNGTAPPWSEKDRSRWLGVLRGGKAC